MKYRERFVDDESFVVSINTQYLRSVHGPLTVDSLARHNLYTRVPPQFARNVRIKQIFDRFQLELAGELIQHVADFTKRIGWSEDVCFISLFLLHLILLITSNCSVKYITIFRRQLHLHRKHTLHPDRHPRAEHAQRRM
jgi:hypothetical protein